MSSLFKLKFSDWIEPKTINYCRSPPSLQGSLLQWTVTNNTWRQSPQICKYCNVLLCIEEYWRIQGVPINMGINWRFKIISSFRRFTFFSNVKICNFSRSQFGNSKNKSFKFLQVEYKLNSRKKTSRHKDDIKAVT